MADGETMYQIQRHPLNSEGDFYVEDMCLCCDAPITEAPELMAYDKNFHCYFKRQPENELELQHAIDAVRVSCIEAVRYGGSNPKILAEICRPYGNAPVVDLVTNSITDKILAFLRKLLGRE